MNPALLVKLKPVTPWRIAPEDGARDRVGFLYHSDTLFSAVTLAMQGFGWMERWLEATTGAAIPAVRFSSCYPFHQQTLLIAPPRNVWPPPPSTRVRWKAARFVPLRVVESLLEPNARLREDDWVVDGESECLLPASRSGRVTGPMRRAVRRTAPVDRLTGAIGEPGVTACLEFSSDCGLWFVAVFSSPQAQEEWAGPLQTCLRYLADSGFGGERSLGWGRSAAPEFRDGIFPDLILVPKVAPVIASAVVSAPAVSPLAVAPAIAVEEGGPAGLQTEAPAVAEPAPEAATEPQPESAELTAPAVESPDAAPAEVPAVSEDPAPPAEPVVTGEPVPSAEPAVVAEPVSTAASLPVDETSAEAQPAEAQPAEAQPAEAQPAEAQPAEAPSAEALPEPEPPASHPSPAENAYWLLSLFRPGAQDGIDWTKGSYSLVERAGRVESPAAAGAEKKLVRMVGEGSVVFASTALNGSVADVAPEGFAHPVYRAGYALAIPIPWRVVG